MEIRLSFINTGPPPTAQFTFHFASPVNLGWDRGNLNNESLNGLSGVDW